VYEVLTDVCAGVVLVRTPKANHKPHELSECTSTHLSIQHSGNTCALFLARVKVCWKIGWYEQ